MIGAIQRPQRITRTACSISPSAPLRAEELAERLQRAVEQRGQQHEIDREQRRGERPVDDARDRFRPEQPDAAGDLAEIDRAVFVEDRIGDEIAEPAAAEAIIDVRIGPEFVDDDVDLRPRRNTSRSRPRRRRRAATPSAYLRQVCIFVRLRSQNAAVIDAARRRRHRRARRRRKRRGSARRRSRTAGRPDRRGRRRRRATMPRK